MKRNENLNKISESELDKEYDQNYREYNKLIQKMALCPELIEVIKFLSNKNKKKLHEYDKC